MINKAIHVVILALGAASLTLAVLGFGTWLCWSLLAGAVLVGAARWLVHYLIGALVALQMSIMHHSGHGGPPPGSRQGSALPRPQTPMQAPGQSSSSSSEQVDDFMMVSDFSTGIGAQMTSGGPANVVFIKVKGQDAEGEPVERVLSMGPWSALRMGLAIAMSGMQLGESYSGAQSDQERNDPQENLRRGYV